MPDAEAWADLFEPFADAAILGITTIAPVALGVAGLIFVLTRGKGVFKRLAS